MLHPEMVFLAALQMVSVITQASMLDVLLKHVYQLLAFFAHFPKVVKVLLKV